MHPAARLARQSTIFLVHHSPCACAQRDVLRHRPSLQVSIGPVAIRVHSSSNSGEFGMPIAGHLPLNLAPEKGWFNRAVLSEGISAPWLDHRQTKPSTIPAQRRRVTKILGDLLAFAARGATRSCGCRMSAGRCALTGIPLDPPAPAKAALNREIAALRGEDRRSRSPQSCGRRFAGDAY